MRKLNSCKDFLIVGGNCTEAEDTDTLHEDCIVKNWQSGFFWGAEKEKLLKLELFLMYNES